MHLSDLHASRDDGKLTSLLENLLEDIKDQAKYCENIIIVVTGQDAHYKEIIKGDVHSNNTTNTTNTTNNTINIFTPNEWDKSERYFRNRGEELRGNEQAYIACKEMEKYAKKRDAKGLRKFFKSLAKCVLTEILAKVTEYDFLEIFQKLATISV